jgi:hypothetical protein
MRFINAIPSSGLDTIVEMDSGPPNACTPGLEAGGVQRHAQRRGLLDMHAPIFAVSSIKAALGSSFLHNFALFDQRRGSDRMSSALFARCFATTRKKALHDAKNATDR